MTVQTSQVIFVMEKNKTSVTYQTLMMLWQNKLQKGRKISYPEISFYHGVFCPKVYWECMEIERADAVGFKTKMAKYSIKV